MSLWRNFPKNILQIKRYLTFANKYSTKPVHMQILRVYVKAYIWCWFKSLPTNKQTNKQTTELPQTFWWKIKKLGKRMLAFLTLLGYIVADILWLKRWRQIVVLGSKGQAKLPNNQPLTLQRRSLWAIPLLYFGRSTPISTHVTITI